MAWITTYIIAFLAGLGFAVAPIQNTPPIVGILLNLLIFFPILIAFLPRIQSSKRWVVIGGSALAAMVIESIGVATGLPYGSFQYSNLLGPKLFDLIPVLLPFTYLPILFMGLTIGSIGSDTRLQLVLKSMLALVMIDLIIDPIITYHEFWIWEHGSYYGVPWSNTIGWIISGLIISAIASIGWKRIATIPSINTTLALLIFWTATAITLQFWIPAIIGVTLMTYTWNQRGK